MRWGEMAGLRVKRLNIERRRVVVAETVVRVSGRAEWGPTKGHERREIALPRFLIAPLAELDEGKRPDDLVFPDASGKPLRSQTFQRSVLTPAAVELRLCDFADPEEQRPVKVLHPHELRHTAASLAIAAGADIKVVQSMLGHQSATMTLDQYGHLFGDRLATVADAVEAARTAALGPNVYPMWKHGTWRPC
jgi:integrase